MPGMGDTSNNIAPPQPVESAKSLGGFGISPTDINLVDAQPQNLQDIRDSMQGALDSLQQRVAAPNWFNVAAGFLTPGPGGFLGELGQADKALGQFVEQRRQMALPIAQMKTQLAQANLLLSQNQDAANIYQNLLSANGGDLTKIDPSAVSTAYAKAAAIAPNSPATKALGQLLHNQQTVASIPGTQAASATAGLHLQQAAISQGEPGVAKNALSLAQQAVGTPGVSVDPNAIPGSVGVEGHGAATPSVPSAPAPSTPTIPPGAVAAAFPVASPTVSQQPLGAQPSQPSFAPGQPPLAYQIPPAVQARRDQEALGILNQELQSQQQALQTATPQQAPGVQQNIDALQREIARMGAREQSESANAGEPSTAPSSMVSQAPPPAAQSPASGNVPLDLSGLSPQQMRPLFGGNYTPASAGAPVGTVLGSEKAYGQALNQMGDIAGNPATLANKTTAMTTVLDALQNNPTAQKQFQDVVGRLAQEPGLFKGLLSGGISVIGTKFFDIDAKKFVQSSIPAPEATMADNVARAMAETAALDSQFRGMSLGHGITASQADVVTGGLPNTNMTPKAALLSMLQAMTNAKRVETLYSGYGDATQALNFTPDGVRNLTPNTTFFTSPWYKAVNQQYDSELKALGDKLGH